MYGSITVRWEEMSTSCLLCLVPQQQPCHQCWLQALNYVWFHNSSPVIKGVYKVYRNSRLTISDVYKLYIIYASKTVALPLVVSISYIYYIWFRNNSPTFSDVCKLYILHGFATVALPLVMSTSCTFDMFPQQ